MVGQQHIVIVGAGIIGLSTAYALLANGKRRVTLLEQATVDHQRSASSGFSRLLRFEYGADALYTDMVRLSLTRWKKLERAAQRTLYTPTGVLVLGTQDDAFPRASYKVARRMGLPTVSLSEEQCNSHFPQFSTRAYDTFTYNAEGGILHASTCLQTLRDMILDRGGTIYEGCRLTQIAHDSQRHPIRLYLSSGEEMTADKVVVAAGPWIHRLLSGAHLPVRMTRQYLLYFAGLPNSLFKAGACPAFLADNLYGFPIHKGCNGWLKAASHDFGVPVSPAAPDEITPPDADIIARIRQQLQELLPALRHAQLARIDPCMYDVSPDEDFILDHLPYDPRIIVATGLSGHGFKFGLLLGEILSGLACDTKPPVPTERFRLNRFSRKQHLHSISVA